MLNFYVSTQQSVRLLCCVNLIVSHWTPKHVSKQKKIKINHVHLLAGIIYNLWYMYNLFYLYFYILMLAQWHVSILSLIKVYYQGTSLIKIVHNWYGFLYVYMQLKTDDNRKIVAFMVRVSDLVKTSLFHVCNWLQWKRSTINLRADITCGCKVTEVRNKRVFLCGGHRESFCDRSTSWSVVLPNVLRDTEWKNDDRKLNMLIIQGVS